MDGMEHCVVTGSSSGIGLALVKRLLAAGWSITGIDQNPPSEDLGKHFKFHCIDLLQTDAIDSLPLLAAQGSVTAFVHCAGIMRGDLDPAVRAKAGTSLWLLHVAAPEALIRKLMPAFPDKRGRILVMSSRASQGRAQRVFYAASKAGIEAMVRCFAAELIGRGISVNALAPASTDTPMLRDPNRKNMNILNLPFGRLIEADEIASMIEFFISSGAGPITGQTLFVCGGASIPGL